MNLCIYTGRLGAEPEMRAIQSGTKVASLRLAADSGRKPKEGEQAQPMWLSVIAWGSLAESCTCLHKGDLVVVAGKQQVRQYKDREGNNKTAHEVVADSIALDIRTLAKRAGASTSQAVEAARQVLDGQDMGDLSLDDLPF
jgi:single-strand DNA-binding protein